MSMVASAAGGDSSTTFSSSAICSSIETTGKLIPGGGNGKLSPDEAILVRWLHDVPCERRNSSRNA